MIYNEFPYSNFHELNLDWILEQVKKAGGDYDAVRAELEQLKKDLEKEHAADTNFYSNERAWHVIKVKEGYLLTKYFIKTGTVTTFQRLTVNGDDRINLGYWMPDHTSILPLPLNFAAVSGNVESYFGIVLNAAIQNKATLTNRVLLLDSAAGPQGNTVTVGLGMMVAGEHAVPPKEPENMPVLPKRVQAVEIADSYYRARTVLGREYAYGENAITYAASDVINNANGAAMMECDTLVALVMMGIPYSESPYADDTPGLTFDFNDLVENPNNLSWPLPWKFDATLNRKVTYTGGQNWWFWNAQRVFKDPTLAASGDVAIFRRDGGKYFDGITHIGIVNRIDGRLWLYHVTGLSGVPSPMMYEPLDDVLKRGGYTLEDNVYFARPDYT